MSDDMDTEEKALRLPNNRAMLLELRRKPHDEALLLLDGWIEKAIAIGHNAGLSEGLARASEPVKRTTLSRLDQP